MRPAPRHVIGDIGSGTGLFGELFLKNGNRIMASNPQQAMREAGEDISPPPTASRASKAQPNPPRSAIPA